MKHDIEISDFDYIASTMGNAFFSGISYTELWDCVRLSTNREEFDAAVSITIETKERFMNARQNTTE